MKTKSSPLTKLVLSAMDDLKAVDVKVLDVMSQTPMTDAMIICTGTSNRHVRSIAENVVREAKHAGHQPQGVEGLNGGEWVLVDLGGVVVHVMQAQTRAFYQLEKLWEMAPAAEPDVARSRAKLKKKAGKPAARRKGGKPRAKKRTTTPAKKGRKSSARKTPARRGKPRR